MYRQLSNLYNNVMMSRRLDYCLDERIAKQLL